MLAQGSKNLSKVSKLLIRHHTLLWGIDGVL